MGLTLNRAPIAEIPLALSRFLAAAHTTVPRSIYMDGSFAVDALLLATLIHSPTDLIANYGVAATGVYLPPAQGLPAVALRISTPPGSSSNAYFQELLEISISVLASRHINVACSHPPLVKLRHTSRRYVLPNIPASKPSHRTALASPYHLWSDTELGGDIGNGRLSTKLLEDLLQISSTHKIAPADLKATHPSLTVSSTCIIQCSPSGIDV
jgi:hypothetical protein